MVVVDLVVVGIRDRFVVLVWCKFLWGVLIIIWVLVLLWIVVIILCLIFNFLCIILIIGVK